MKSYFVLYQRDIKTEKTKDYGARMLYDRLKEFKDLAAATNFALSNLPAILAARPPLAEEAKPLVKSGKTTYVVAVEFLGKYSHTDYTGDTEKINTWDVVRCEQSDLEKIMEKLSSEGSEVRGQSVERMLVGLELDMFKTGETK